MDVQIKKIATMHYNDLLALTAAEARDEVLLHEQTANPVLRMKNAWLALNHRFDDYPQYIVLAMKQRLENLLVYTTVEAKGDIPGVYRQWRPDDSLMT